MRIFGKKIWENAYQQQLERLKDYNADVEPEVLRDELYKLDGHDGANLVAGMHMWHHRFVDGFSIADIVKVMDHARLSRPYQSSGNGRENIDSLVRGGEAMVASLIKRANDIAGGIHSGASLAHAFEKA